MYVTCKCLNVSIKTKDCELRCVNIDEIELSVIEQSDSFFKNDLVTVNKLENITKEQPTLVEVRSVGAWVIHRCYNCLMYTHAIHREYGAAMVLINTNLVKSEEEITKLKNSPNFSRAFRIVVDRTKADDYNPLEPPAKFSAFKLSSNLRVALEGLEQQLEEAIQRQAIVLDEKIRAFTREQYQILNDFRDRAHTEHNILARLITSELQTVGGSTNLETPPATPETIQPTKSTSTNDDIDATATFISKNAVQPQNVSSKPPKNMHAVNGNSDDIRIQDFNSYDEAMFILEGMDDSSLTIRHLQASDQESDTDDSGNEGMHITRGQRSGHPTLAKSLPVTVPAFHYFGQRTVQEVDDEQISRDPMDPHNIQASIKALANSVHGDALFGDLPRPRISTQI